MDRAQEIVVRWDEKILPIWLRRLVRLSSRETGDPQLRPVFALCDDLASSLGWAIHGVVPLEADPHGHQWAAWALSPSGQNILAHGLTPAGAFAELHGLMAGANE
jgi:hypothetical protein